MTNVTFQPGKFQPLIVVGVQPTSEAESLLPDYDGIDRVATRTAQLAFIKGASAGGALALDTNNFPGDVQIITHTLAARNIAEQLRTVHQVHTRVTTPLVNPPVRLLEPIAKVYNYYGHVKVDSKTYMIQDARSKLAMHLVQLAKYATIDRTTTGMTTNAQGDLADIDFRRLTVNADGDLASTNLLPLEERTILWSQAFLGSNNLPNAAKRTLAIDALNATSESGLKFVIRSARTRGFTAAEQAAVTITLPNLANNAHRDALRLLFNDNSLTVGNGDAFPAKKVIAVISRAYLAIKRHTDSLDMRMKTLVLPKYEGGSRAQLAWIDESEVLYSQFQLGADDVTVAYTCNTSFSARLVYRVAPGDSPDVLLDQLIDTSIIK